MTDAVAIQRLPTVSYAPLRLMETVPWLMLAVDALRELWDRSICMVPAIIAVSFADIGLSVCQGMVRNVVYAFWHSSSAPSLVRALVFFFFIFAFASIRLWTTLAILVFALRELYRRGVTTT